VVMFFRAMTSTKFKLIMFYSYLIFL
jgi:hypothetical protein